MHDVCQCPNGGLPTPRRLGDHGSAATAPPRQRAAPSSKPGIRMKIGLRNGGPVLAVLPGEGRAMFDFLRSRNDPLADAKSAERWLAAAGASDSLARHEIL